MSVAELPSIWSNLPHYLGELQHMRGDWSVTDDVTGMGTNLDVGMECGPGMKLGVALLLRLPSVPAVCMYILCNQTELHTAITNTLHLFSHL